jgi:cell division protein FtsA
VQLTRSGWSLDGAPSVPDPTGMAGRELSVEVHAVTADEPPLRNLLMVTERCYLEVDRMFAAPYASSLAATTEQERNLGVLCVDIGGGTTTLAVFANGQFVHTESLPVGGNHVTYDIARGLTTPLAEAERIKALYGNLAAAASDELELISFPVAGEDASALYQTSKAELRGIIAPRIAGLYGLVEERLERGGLSALKSGRVVLTGGASQLPGLDSVWTSRFGGMVRVGRPQPLERMSSEMCSPAFAAVVGLVHAAAVSDASVHGGGRGESVAEGYIGRMHQWFRESF